MFGAHSLLRPPFLCRATTLKSLGGTVCILRLEKVDYIEGETLPGMPTRIWLKNYICNLASAVFVKFKNLFT